MFDIGWGKIVIIAVIALIVIGPKELPAVLRTVGQWMGKIRRMAAEFQGQFQEAMREAEMADLKKSVDAIAEATRDIGKGFDPLDSVRKDVESSFAETPAASAPPPAAEAPAPEAAAAVAPGAEPAATATLEPLPQPAPQAAGPADAGAAAPAPVENAGGRAA
ncbi:MAG TPA: Sec-independent protein translocase protein TatB [Xanthobacteraceae bacterium]|nr:Sec-independent protein translocase protein TatB [Xanthobacteraceae bacterium]